MPSSVPSANRAVTVLLAILSLAACGEGGGKPATAPAVSTRATDAAQLARGAELYRTHCATCHGERAQGASNWQKPGPDGKYPAPPLDGTAHAWHHPLAALKATIRDGTLRLGGNMPSWRGTIAEPDIEAIILWFQSFWPEEIYQVWRQMDERARRGSSGA